MFFDMKKTPKPLFAVLIFKTTYGLTCWVLAAQYTLIFCTMSTFKLSFPFITPAIVPLSQLLRLLS